MSNSDVTKSFFVGSASGAISALLFQPLDVIKTRRQIATQALSGSNSTYGFLVRNVYRNDGIFGFWKGLSPTLLRCVPGVGLYFSTLHFLNSNVISEKPNAFETISVAALARAIAAMCFNPVTIVKIRFESGEYNYRGIIHAVQDIREKEGFRGFTRGLMPTVIRDVPFAGLYYLFYTRIKVYMDVENTEKNSSLGKFVSGMTAGCLASLITHPADVIKTYSQLYPNEFSRFFVGLRFIQEKFGMKGYFRGASVRLLRRTLVTAVSWTVYEKVYSFVQMK